MVILKPSRTKTRGSTRAASAATGLSVCVSRFTSSTSRSALAKCVMGVTRATMSHGVRRTTSRLESLRTTASSTVKSSDEIVDIAASTARRAPAASICLCVDTHARPACTVHDTLTPRRQQVAVWSGAIPLHSHSVGLLAPHLPHTLSAIA